MSKEEKEKLVAAVDFEHPTYFVGYGSLMYPSGINGRGMHHFYDWKDLMPITIKGLRRSFCSVFGKLAFYGVYQKEDSEINAVAFEIHSQHDYAMLLNNERAHPFIDPPLYKTLDVADKIVDCKLPGKVMILESLEIDEENGFLPEYYVRSVINGIKSWGPEFVSKFLETGGVAYDPSNFNVYVEYAWDKTRMIKCAKRQ
jgi:hypothetical protein